MLDENDYFTDSSSNGSCHFHNAKKLLTFCGENLNMKTNTCFFANTAADRAMVGMSRNGGEEVTTTMQLFNVNTARSLRTENIGVTDG